MKSLKKALLLLMSVATLSAMAITASAASSGDGKSPANSKTSIAEATVTSPSLSYTGKKQKASFTVKVGTTELKENVDYKVVGKRKQKNSGTYTVKIQGLGKYTGEKTVQFTIEAKKGKKSSTKITGNTKKKVKSAKNKARKAKFSFNSANKQNTLSIIKVKKYKAKSKKYKKVSAEGWVVKRGKNNVTIKVPKGTAKGTYKVKVEIPAYNNLKKTTRTFYVTVG